MHKINRAGGLCFSPAEQQREAADWEEGKTAALKIIMSWLNISPTRVLSMILSLAVPVVLGTFFLPFCCFFHIFSITPCSIGYLCCTIKYCIFYSVMLSHGNILAVIPHLFQTPDVPKRCLFFWETPSNIAAVGFWMIFIVSWWFPHLLLAGGRASLWAGCPWKQRNSFSVYENKKYSHTESIFYPSQNIFRECFLFSFGARKDIGGEGAGGVFFTHLCKCFCILIYLATIFALWLSRHV